MTNIDGRNVPLTVGYHKVTVDIRDQIARTTIEESFVNHTNVQLEGTFFFPLPQDASIAGFGMWIGDRLVEADIVEKQRAREIYEEILRQKRDPGLLEWSGGNIFKARVFPIFPQSEKRITITYTQVLPMRGNAYRYQYALQSELLKQHPLRELEIDVKINSALPLRSVSSPTHLTRNALTAHSAHVEFSAKEYTPTQDFEVVVEAGGRQSDVVLIPHRRGEDGYFLLQLTPPVRLSRSSPGEKRTVGRGRPVRSRGPVAARGAPRRPTAGASAAGRHVGLDGRPRPRASSRIGGRPAGRADAQGPIQPGHVRRGLRLGLRPAGRGRAEPRRRGPAKTRRPSVVGMDRPRRAAASALAQCGPKTQVVYIGDGIVTTGDGDPVAFVKRLRRLAEGKPGTFHAVAVSSSFEPGVMRAIASLGGGSFREVSGSRGPTAVAMELLGEITRPVLRDLKVEFRGLRTARVYPDPLPNLPLGTQQIILGRYVPQGEDQSGEVVVTGTLAGKPVRFTARVSLKDAESGNSFIPRLWARMHLDALLEQGASEAVKDEIIALSEEYHIITPYTSLLVLESDADREAFGVKRRFQMRDGEKFFAEGRENANWELIQQQMKAAGTWRLGLRSDVLRQLATLGRHVAVVQPSPRDWGWRYMPGEGDTTVIGWGVMVFNGVNEELIRHTVQANSWEEVGGPEGIVNMESDGKVNLNRLADLGVCKDLITESSALPKSAPAGPGAPMTAIRVLDFDALRAGESSSESGEWAVDAGQNIDHGKGEGEDQKFEVMDLVQPAKPASAAACYLPAVGWREGGKPFRGTLNYWSLDGNYYYARGPIMGPAPLYARRMQTDAWLNELFPSLPAPPVKPREPKRPWPAEARTIARSLLRTEHLTGVRNGLRIESETQSFNPRWNELTSRGRTSALVSPDGWLIKSGSDNSQTTLAWADARERGAIGMAFLLGRVRPAKPADLARPPLDLGVGVLTPLDLGYANYSVQVKPAGQDRTLLVLKAPWSPNYEQRILVDTARHVVLKSENVVKGKVTYTTTFDNFVEVAGAWYAGRIEDTTAEDGRITLTTRKFIALAPGDFARQWKQELAVLDRVQLLREPLPTLAEAKKAAAAGKAGFEDQMILLLHFQATQQWDRVLDHLAAAEKRSGKPGMCWVRTALLQLGRKAEDAKRRYFEEAASLAAKVAVPPKGDSPIFAAKIGTVPTAKIGTVPAAGDDVFLAQYIVGSARQVLQAGEMLRLLDALRPVYGRQPAHRHAMKTWTELRIEFLEQTGQSGEVLKLRGQLARDYPQTTPSSSNTPGRWPGWASIRRPTRGWTACSCPSRGGGPTKRQTCGSAMPTCSANRGDTTTWSSTLGRM